VSEASIQQTRRFSAIWIVPIVALIIGGWTLVQSYLAKGPQVEITFSTAEGLVAGETAVKTLDVEVGVVESVELAGDFASVRALVRMDPQAVDLLTEDAKFWVVRPRIGSGGISGLSTILSGAHIQLTPGTGEKGWRRFRGLDDMPITPPSTPGLQLQLLADSSSSINAGSPVLYNGYRVGRVEDVTLDPLNGQTRYAAFIEAPYDDLVTSNTRFWNASGVSVSVGVNGFDVRTESLEAIVTGGVAFAVPGGSSRGQSVGNGALFSLYNDVGELTANPHVHSTEYLLLFDSSIRGLEVDSPVEYRGMRVGTVLSVGLRDIQWDALWSSQEANTIPVLIRIEPGWLGEDTELAANAFALKLEDAVRDGLRASLGIGNLLTGALYVSLDFEEEVAFTEIGTSNGLPLMPTVASGLDQIEGKIASFLNKLQQLPLNETVEFASSAMQEVERTLAEARVALGAVSELLESDEVDQLPASLIDTLTEARGMLQGFSPDSSMQQELIAALQKLNGVLSGADTVLQTFERKPNALVFPIKTEPDIVPRGVDEN
jgi:paraquat-inducible protein B